MSEILSINHPQGHGTLAALGASISVDLNAITQIVLPGAQVHNGLFEVPYRQAMAVLLPSLHPATPAYGSLMFVHAPESPIGAFDFALFGVACRSGIRPRMLNLTAFASSNAAVALLGTFGFAARKAVFDNRFGYDAAVSTLSGDDGAVIARMSTSMADILLGSTRAVRYPQPLTPVDIDGAQGLLQLDMAFEYDEASRGPMQLSMFDSAAVSSGRITPTDLIGGTFVRANIALQPPRLLLDPNVVGLATKLTGPQKAAA